MSWIEAIAVTMGALVFMEFFAWFAHKYIMHGFAWGWHRDHHEPHDNTLEKNDLFAVVFGTVNAAMYIFGALYWDALWWAALGINLYGVVYAVVHDGMVHQRFGRYVPKNAYAKRLVQAHRLHHATIGKEGGVSFGFVLARDPAKLKTELREQAKTGVARVRDSARA
ncbi:sterol desaturase family protein [Erythrobacter sp.]|jgi:beta-carotene 3-hydroxylase|uniref:sterol desaturase family protein n=1 Tax=Erythrobacter sp. TaxID=1042 RepID=UPI002EBF2DA7|nr:sterol desaturase family protein [Erythrobacter sp.]